MNQEIPRQLRPTEGTAQLKPDMGATYTVPVILINGVAEAPMAAAAISLQWDLRAAVAVRHEFDPARERLTRTVSDATGILEHVDIDVEDACINCATRDDLISTLERLAASGSWAAIIAQLPIGVMATQVCQTLHDSPHIAVHLRIAAVIAALEAETVCDDLLGDDLFTERGLPVRADDERGVGEIASAMVEYADLVTSFGTLQPTGWELLRTLAHPSALLTNTFSSIAPETVLAGLHQHHRNEAWVSVVRRETISPANGGAVWTLDFRSDRPFHPDRLQERIEILGRGRRRSRGCFWLPTRPSQVCQWDGAGGMVSIGHSHDWEHEPLTRIVIVGTDNQRETLEQAFNSCLLTDAELAERGRFWEVPQDGLEPWLGPVRSFSTEQS